MSVFYQNTLGGFLIYDLFTAGARLASLNDSTGAITSLGDLDGSDPRNYQSADWHPDDDFLALCKSSFGNKIDIYKRTSPTELTRLTTGVPTWSSFKVSSHFSSDGTLLLGGGESATRLEIAEISGDTFTLISPDPFNVQPGVNQFHSKFSPEVNLIATGGNNITPGPLFIYERGAGTDFTNTTASALDAQVNAGTGSPIVFRGGIDFSPDGNYLAVAGHFNNGSIANAGYLTVYERTTPTTFTTVSANLLGVTPGAAGGRGAVKFTRDSKFLYYSHDGATGEVKLQGWKVNSGAFDAIGTIGVTLSGGTGSSLATNHDDQYLLIGVTTPTDDTVLAERNKTTGVLTTVDADVPTAGANVLSVSFSNRTPNQ